jgi:hypothetical protein
LILSNSQKLNKKIKNLNKILVFPLQQQTTTQQQTN